MARLVFRKRFSKFASLMLAIPGKAYVVLGARFSSCGRMTGNTEIVGALRIDLAKRRSDDLRVLAGIMPDYPSLRDHSGSKERDTSSVRMAHQQDTILEEADHFSDMRVIRQLAARTSGRRFDRWPDW